MEHLFSAWSTIAPQLRGAKRILLLSDYDGTLTPIVERPEQAILSDGMREQLRRLAVRRQFKVGIISGRALADLKDKVGINGIIYAGNHGLEIDGPGLSFIHPLAEEVKPFFRVVYGVLRLAMGAIRGVRIEDKELTLSVHYRQVPENRVDEVKDVFKRVTASPESLGKVRTTAGKMVLEVRPAVDWDKGKAIRMLMKRYGKGGRNSGMVPIYLGDDRTDEDGFRVIERYGNGISVFVGEENAETRARYFLKSTEEVSDFLKLLLEDGERGLV